VWGRASRPSSGSEEAQISEARKAIQLIVHHQAVTMGKMKKIIQVHIFKGESHFVAECLDLPVVTQGKTLDELAQNLREAIALQLEGENPADFGLADNPSILASFELEPLGVWR